MRVFCWVWAVCAAVFSSRFKAGLQTGAGVSPAGSSSFLQVAGQGAPCEPETSVITGEESGSEIPVKTPYLGSPGHYKDAFSVRIPFFPFISVQCPRLQSPEGSRSAPWAPFFLSPLISRVVPHCRFLLQSWTVEFYRPFEV